MCHDGKELMKDGEIKTVWTAPSQGRELCYIVICTTLPSANAILFLPVSVRSQPLVGKHALVITVLTSTILL